MGLELFLYCLLSAAGCLQWLWFVSYAFGDWLRPWDPQYYVLALPLACIFFGILRRVLSLHSDRIWFTCLLLRATLAWMMMVYGLGKVWNQQFTPPSFLAQDVRIFEASGFWKAWAFFGHSSSYEVFLGWGEVIGALFLGFAPTTNLGAAMLAVMLLNIGWINWTHDIGVRLASALYLVQALLLMKPEAARWMNFLLGRATPARAVAAAEIRYRRPLLQVGLVYLALMLAYFAWTQKRHSDYLKQPVAGVVGVWLAQDEQPVQRLRFENIREGSLGLREADVVPFACEYQEDSGRLSWSVQDPRFSRYNFVGTVRLLNPTTLELAGPDPAVAGVYQRVLPRP